MASAEIDQFFTFSRRELTVIARRRGPLNRLSVGLQIGFLRMTNRAHAELVSDASRRGAEGPFVSSDMIMLGSCPVVSHQVATTEATAQEFPTDECRAAATAPLAVRSRAPGPLLRGGCVAGDRRRAGRQQIISWPLG
jgi:hypothetical protein